MHVCLRLGSAEFSMMKVGTIGFIFFEHDNGSSVNIIRKIRNNGIWCLENDGDLDESVYVLSTILIAIDYMYIICNMCVNNIQY